MLQTLQLKTSSLPTSRAIWAHLLAQEIRQRQTPDAVALLRQAGMEPDPWQRQVAETRASRTLLNCCRQAGKSEVAAALALATAMREPRSLTLVLSPSLRQSAESFR